MNKWTTEARYQKLEDASADMLEALKAQVDASPYRQTYHIQPETGLLNDPNGLIYFKGQYYVSHQWFPLGPVHGLKYWYNYTSKDLVHFEPQGAILSPDTTFDSHGVYSGSAFEYEGALYVMYTGNHRTANWERVPYQMIAKMTKDNTYEKFEHPVIEGAPDGYTAHFRDPKVFEYQGQLYACIGAQNDAEEGRVLLYRARTLTDWVFEGELKTDLTAFGYMWECPDYFKLGDTDILLFSPQGIQPDGEKYRNIYQSGYVKGKLDVAQCEMTHDAFEELDAGFDFYAPQTFEDEKGRRVLIGWMGLPEIDYPTDLDGWAHCLTIPRVLTMEDGKLKQRPYPALEKLRLNEETALGYANKFVKQLYPYDGVQYELNIDILENEATALYFDLRTSKKHQTTIIYDCKSQSITLDRSESGLLPESVEDTRRTTYLDTPLSKLQIFVDTSSIEIFCNDGERVLTSRIFPEAEATGIRASTESGQVYLKFTKYALKGAQK